MKYFDWDAKKNVRLKEERGISFEEILVVIDEGGILDVLEHTNIKRYPGQKILVVAVDEYVYLVPFVEDDTKVFLKTIIPSRKATKEYIIKRKREQT